MNPAQKAVELVRKLFADAYTQGCLWETWMLVAALRGPDNEDAKLKDQYTLPVRKALLANSHASVLGLSGFAEFMDVPQIGPQRLCSVFLKDTNLHWHRHIHLAARILKDAQTGKDVDDET